MIPEIKPCLNDELQVRRKRYADEKRILTAEYSSRDRVIVKVHTKSNSEKGETFQKIFDDNLQNVTYIILVNDIGTKN